MNKRELKRRLKNEIKNSTDLSKICDCLLEELKEATNEDIENISVWDWCDNSYDLACLFYVEDDENKTVQENFDDREKLERKIYEKLFY